MELITELTSSGNDKRNPLMDQIALPLGFEGETYMDLVIYLMLEKKMIPLGLYRKKSENVAWRLSYVVTNPPMDEILEPSDRVFIIRENTEFTIEA